MKKLKLFIKQGVPLEYKYDASKMTYGDDLFYGKWQIDSERNLIINTPVIVLPEYDKQYDDFRGIVVVLPSQTGEYRDRFEYSQFFYRGESFMAKRLEIHIWVKNSEAVLYLPNEYYEIIVESSDKKE